MCGCDAPLDYREEIENKFERLEISHRNSMKELEESVKTQLETATTEMKSLIDNAEIVSRNAEKSVKEIEIRMIRLLEGINKQKTEHSKDNRSIHSSRTLLIDDQAVAPARSSGPASTSAAVFDTDLERQKLLSEVRYNVNQKIERPGS